MIKQVDRLGFLVFTVLYGDKGAASARTCSTKDGKKKLSPKGSKVLFLLCENLGKTVDKQHIQMQVWGDYDYFIGRSLDVYLRKIRVFLQGSKYEILRDGVGRIRLQEIQKED